jgi:pimeloyl-ACP methyl ester carboxylesterase
MKFKAIVFGFLLMSASAFAADTVKLSDGNVSYELSGPSDGQLVVLIHGVSGPMMVWDNNVDALTEAGYQVLRFDLYGRGGSERVKKNYDLPLYLRELTELLTVLKLEKPLNLVGSSMGAIIATAFTLEHPEKVQRLALIGPAGFKARLPASIRSIEVPEVSDLIFKIEGEKAVLEQNRRYFYEPENFEAFLDSYKEQLKINGSLEAILSTLRNVPLQNYLSEYEKLTALKTRVLLIWGLEDDAFPYRNHRELLASLPHADFLGVPRAAHLPQYEQAELVNLSLTQFLKR